MVTLGREAEIQRLSQVYLWEPELRLKFKQKVKDMYI